MTSTLEACLECKGEYPSELLIYWLPRGDAEWDLWNNP